MSIKNNKLQLEWITLSLIAGAVISLAIAWLTSWIFIRSEDQRLHGDASGRIFAYGPGLEDNRWMVDSTQFAFGVWISEIENREGRAFHPSLVRDRTGPSSIPHWSRARSVPDEKIFRYKYNSVRDEESYWYKKVFEVAAGWPFTSWKGEWRALGLTGSSENWFCIPLYSKPGGDYPILLPLMPIFPGAFFNIFFWGGIFFVFTTDTKRSIWFFIRHRRRRRGRCPHCAYDITGLTTCPECGQEVIGSTTRSTTPCKDR